MSYVGRTIWDKRLPPYMGILVLLFALGLTLLLSRNTVQFVSRATVESTPKNIQISNITATSFTISYTTDVNALSTVTYGADPSMGQVATDVRDLQTGKPGEYRTHYITVKNLLPATRYYYSITSGAQVITDSGNPFEVMTASDISTPPSSNATMVGSVALEDGTMPKEGIVYVSSATSQLLSALVLPDGSYSLPMSTLRTKDLRTYIPLFGSNTLHLEVTNGLQQSKATLLNEQAAEIPKIILSKDYDFTLNPDDLVTTLATGSAEESSGSGNFPIFDEPVAVTSPEITTPTENQAFKDQQPMFKGKALPKTAIQIIIQAEKEITASLESDDNGNWEFRPPTVLGTGNHLLTVSSVDVNGALQKLERNFSVNASGSQFTEPSVSPIEISPTQAPPITPTIPALPSPTASATPTLEPTATPPLAPTTDPNASLSPTRGPLTATGSYSTIAGFLMSVLFLAGGVLLFFSIAV